MTKIFRIKNLDCANCASKIESKLNKLKSINNASVNYLTQKIMIDYNEEFNLEEVIRVCKKIEPDCEIL